MENITHLLDLPGEVENIFAIQLTSVELTHTRPNYT